MIDIKALKSRFIDLAIRGKLVPQLDEEPPVEQIGDAPAEIPFEIPEKWKWVYLCNSVTFNPKVSCPVDGLVSFLGMKDVCAGFANKHLPGEIKSWNEVKNGYTKFCNNDVLLAKITPCFQNRKSAIAKNLVSGVGAGSSEFHVFRCENTVEPEFLLYFFKSDFLINYGVSNFTGTAGQQRVGTQVLKNCLFPLPPISEQHRIVARLNEIFALLDKAEDCYLRVQDLGKSLKNKFLQMAIEGKLVPQLDEEPSVTQIGDVPDEPPFEIPEKWKWVELSAVGNVVGGGTPSTSVLDYWDGTIPWLTPADMGKFTSKYVEKCSKFITQKGLDHSSAKLMPKGTVIYSSRAPIGYVAIAKDSICTNQGCKSLVPNTEFVISEYIYFCLINRTEDIKFRASGTTFKEISGRNFGETLIPLPPISEQHRIVTRLNELFALVDKMTGVEEKE